MLPALLFPLGIKMDSSTEGGGGARVLGAGLEQDTFQMPSGLSAERPGRTLAKRIGAGQWEGSVHARSSDD